MNTSTDNERISLIALMTTLFVCNSAVVLTAMRFGLG